MPKFTFKGVDASGQEIEGSVEDDTQEQAIASIRESGYFPTSVELAVEMAETELPDEASVPTAWSAPPTRPNANIATAAAAASASESAKVGANLQKSESLPPYEMPFIAALHLFAGGCALLAFLVVVFIAATSRSAPDALMWLLWTGLLALINFGLAQIIDIIARASYAARQQVILLRQLVRDNGSTPNV